MAMQTITVNGVKISYNSTPKNSVESSIPLADDGLSLMIQATEAYVESGYQIKALEAIGAFSTEAAPELLKKVGNGVKAVIEKIKQFFVYISAFIKRVFLGASFKAQALAVYMRLKKSGIRKDWKTVKVAGCGNVTTGLKHIKSTRSVLNKIKKLAKVKSFDILYKLANLFVTQYDKIIQEYNQNSFSSDEVTVSKLVSDPNKEILGQLEALSKFSSDISGGLMDVVTISDILTSMCDGWLAETIKDDSASRIKLIRTLQKCINDCSKMYTGVCKSIINIGKNVAEPIKASDVADKVKNTAKVVPAKAKLYAQGAVEVGKGVKKYGVAKTARALATGKSPV